MFTIAQRLLDLSTRRSLVTNQFNSIITEQFLTRDCDLLANFAINACPSSLNGNIQSQVNSLKAIFVKKCHSQLSPFF